MLKVLIVDDEKIQREGLARYIPWGNYNMEVVGCAVDGIEALELIKILLPDILITDVKMPRMDGLELSQKAQELLPDIKILIISGYKEFEFAKTAIELNAYAYIIKPIVMEKMEQQLERLSSKCHEEILFEQEFERMKKQLEDSKPLLLDKFIKELLYGFLDDEEVIKRRADFLSFEPLNREFYVLLIQIQKDLKSGVSEEDIQLYYLDFSNRLSHICKTIGSNILIQIKEGEFALVLFETNMSEKPVHELSKGLRKSMREPFSQTITVGISSKKDNMLQLHEAYKEGEIAVRQKFYMGKGKDIFYQDLDNRSIIPVIVEDRYEKLIINMEMGNIEAVEELTTIIFTRLVQSSSLEEHYIKAFCYRIVGEIYRVLYNMDEKAENIFGEEYMLWNKVCRYDTIPDALQWLKNVISAVTQYIFNKYFKKNQSAVDKIIDILENRYFEHITIDELAKQVFLAPNYISNIFKEKKGESVIDYLTKVRMKNAQRLLCDSSLKIFEVAEKVGFNNTSYFSAVFKGTYGVTPKEYREKVFLGEGYVKKNHS